jgi:hypothetical protein
MRGSFSARLQRKTAPDAQQMRGGAATVRFLTPVSLCERMVGVLPGS